MLLQPATHYKQYSIIKYHFMNSFLTSNQTHNLSPFPLPKNTQLIQEDTRIAFYGAQNNTTPVTKGNYTLKKLEKEKDNLFQKISTSKFRHYKHLPNTNKAVKYSPGPQYKYSHRLHLFEFLKDCSIPPTSVFC